MAPADFASAAGAFQAIADEAMQETGLRPLTRPLEARLRPLTPFGP